jgi:hypothetical protein
MPPAATYALAPLFQAVADALLQNKTALNQADLVNGDHGDHMVEIFDLAAQAAVEKQEANLPQAMTYAAELLEERVENGSAQVYACGLRALADQFDIYDVSLEALIAYVRHALRQDERSKPAAEESASEQRSGPVLKALLSGLANWQKTENGQPAAEHPLDMGALFEFGLAYMQARQRGGERSEILAEAAVSVSPLGKVAHRSQSGKIAIQAFLQAMQGYPAG